MEGGARAAITSGNPAAGVEVRDREHHQEASWRVGRLDLNGKPLGLPCGGGCRWWARTRGGGGAELGIDSSARR
jgi:hypothetical protein